MAASSAGVARWSATGAGGEPGKASVEGSLDDIAFTHSHGWVARGWAVDYGNPDTPVEVEIVEDDTVLGTGVAEEFREDLQQAGIGSGAVAFAIGLPPEVADQEQHRLSLRLAGWGALIVPPTAIQIKRFAGQVDEISGMIMLGWAYDAANLGIPVALEMTIDGDFAGHAVADQFRPDLGEAGLGNAYHGFSWILPLRVADGQPHRIGARFANRGKELDGVVDNFVLLPDQLEFEVRRLVDLHDTARQHLSTIAQSLKAEAQRPRTAKLATIIGLLLDSLDPPPVFETLPVVDRDPDGAAQPEI